MGYSCNTKKNRKMVLQHSNNRELVRKHLVKNRLVSFISYHSPDLLFFKKKKPTITKLHFKHSI